LNFKKKSKNYQEMLKNLPLPQVFPSVKDVKRLPPTGPWPSKSGGELIAVLEKLMTSQKPVVARLAGPARAGGIGLVAACDFAIAADTVTFGFSEVRIGVIPSIISIPLGLRVLPPALQRLFLTHMFPILTPIAVDPAHPFPFILNRGLTLAVEMQRNSDAKAMNGLIPNTSSSRYSSPRPPTMSPPPAWPAPARW